MRRLFHVADITGSGEVRAVEPYEYGLLERVGGAADLIALFSTWLWRSPEGFEVTLPEGHMRVRWLASAETAGIATLRMTPQSGVPWSGQPEESSSEGTLGALSVLLSGKNSDADTITWQALERQMVRELHDSGVEPGFGLRTLEQRPLIATLSLRPPVEAPERLWFALWDRCFAASYFRKQGLA